MQKLRGWGLLLAVIVPLLIFFSHSQLKNQQAQLNLERFNNNTGEHLKPLLDVLMSHFEVNRQIASGAQVNLPAVPVKSGIKSWMLRDDSVAVITFDAQLGAELAVLKLVPFLNTLGTLHYDCSVSAEVAKHIRMCEGLELPDEAAIQQRLAQNNVIAAKPVVSADGTALAAGMRTGSVLALPDDAKAANDCGYNCVKPQSCVSERPLSCSREVTKEGDGVRSGWTETKPSFNSVRASRVATRSEADKICSELGDGFKLAEMGGSGKSELRPGTEYWVHNQGNPAQNCWKTDYRTEYK
jgi:hypothetical protein